MFEWSASENVEDVAIYSVMMFDKCNRQSLKRYTISEAKVS